MSRMQLFTTGLCVLNGAAAVLKSFYEANILFFLVCFGL